MADMIQTLRTLLIACAVASLFVAGMPAPLASSSIATWTSDHASPRDGHREDDAGATAEQAEEDDTEEQVFRTLLVTTEATGALAADLVRHSAGQPACLPAASAWRRAHFSRGPPA